MKLTAMTYNIQSGRNLRRELDTAFAAEIIRSVQPDFVTLNEVRCRTQDVGDVNQADDVARQCGYYPLFGRAIDYDGGEYGNALLTRLPLKAHEVVHIPDPVSRDGDDVQRHQGQGFYEHRIILRAVLEAEGRSLTVLCSHFGLNHSEQVNAVQTALEIAQKEENPVLLMGDFNLPPDAPELVPLLERFADTCAEEKGILTWPADEPRVKIDYILYAGGLKCLGVRSMATTNSDHRPLIAQFEV